ncbi:MAG: zinc-dependent metalloprotease [Planctomycetota bacterium]
MGSMARRFAVLSLTAFTATAGLAAAAAGAETFASPNTSPVAEPSSADKPEFPPFKDVAKDFVKVVSTADGSRPLYSVWHNKKTGDLLAELPAGYQNQRHFFAMTVGAGELYAGLQGNDILTYWRRYDKRVALMTPETTNRSTGDQESKDSVKNIFTDRVLVDVPIVTMGPGGQPVIDLDNLLAGQASKFFGFSARGANTRLKKVVKAKAFPKNLEIALEMPTAGGTLKEFHYSISLVQGSPGFKPRAADQRIGTFNTTYRDLGKFTDDETIVRYANRWHLEKRDPKLKKSPATQPIVYYIEHTTPVRYRRFIKAGAEYWNRAFEEHAGILGAIEIYQQDKSTGAHMDKDPEDVRYNFIRWLSNDIGTAIGPSRPHPETGEILDADVVLTDGWIRYFNYQFDVLLPEIATESFGPETLAWLHSRPQYDPRILLAPAAEREFMVAEREQRGVLRYGGHAAAAALNNADASALYGDNEYDGLNGNRQFNGFCMASRGKAMDLAAMSMHLALAGELISLDEEEGEEDTADYIDGMPDWFIGPMLADLVAHEVGHTLGFSHNFKASSQYTFDEINSEEVKGNAFTASVMDYIPININMPEGGLEAIKNGDAVQGDYAMVDIGVYDEWVVEYVYGPNPEEAIKRGSAENIPYANDLDTWGIDPLARRYDFAHVPLDYVENQKRLNEYYRSNLLDSFVEDGESWAKARRGYNITLGQQMRSVSMMANWIGGAFVERDRKGEENARPPLEVVPADMQRQALDFVLANGIDEDAYGLDPELITYLSNDIWWDEFANPYADRDYKIHDRVTGMMASTLTMIMNPTTLANVYDNEFRVPAGEDAITLPEVMSATLGEVFKELDADPNGPYTPREPMVSSFRRTLQMSTIDRLIDFTRPGTLSGAAATPVRTLAAHHLREIKEKADAALTAKDRLDAYTLSHLSEAAIRIEKALDADYIYNTGDISGGGGVTARVR